MQDRTLTYSYSVSVDGKEIKRVENKSPETLKNVKVFAGDQVLSPSDASYRNLVWETISDNRIWK